MTAPVLARAGLSRVLRSLVLQEIAGSRGRRGETLPVLHRAEWSDEVRLSDDSAGGLGCDSLEVMQVGAAVNEMFHLHEAGDAADLLGDDRVGAWLDAIFDAWSSGVSCLTFTTSGSTGLPKRCPHKLTRLEVEVQFLTKLFDDRHRVVTFAPAHHIYGVLFGALLPQKLGVEVLSAERASAAELTRGLRSGDLVVGFPERWAWLARSLPAWPADVVGTTSTAPCPADLIGSLTERGLSRMVEIYGSSETAGLGTRTTPDAPFALMPHWRRDLAEGGPGSHLIHSCGSLVEMPDHIEWRGERHFVLAGRRDGAVQVGGHNVHPGLVATRLLEHPGVAQAAVRLMRLDEGARLKAFVVPKPGVDAEQLEVDLRHWSTAQLSSAERPRRFTFGSGLPTSALGKLADW